MNHNLGPKVTRALYPFGLRLHRLLNILGKPLFPALFLCDDHSLVCFYEVLGACVVTVGDRFPESDRRKVERVLVSCLFSRIGLVLEIEPFLRVLGSCLYHNSLAVGDLS